MSSKIQVHVDNSSRNKLDASQYLLPRIDCEKDVKTHPRRLMMVVTFSMWMSFASLVLFQANLLQRITHNWSLHSLPLPEKQKNIFEHGVSATFVGTFIFRVGHELFWSAFSSKARVMLSLCCMAVSMTLLTVVFFVLNLRCAWWMVLANAIGGVGVGAIEPNILTSILPLGDDTKLYTFYGMSLGFNFVAVAGFSLLSIGVPLMCIYVSCAVLCIMSIFIYAHVMSQIPSFVIDPHDLDFLRAPPRPLHLVHVNKDASTSTMQLTAMRLKEVKTAFQDYRSWICILLPYGIFFTMNLLLMNLFCTVSLYVFYDGKIPLFTLHNGDVFAIDRNLYFALSGVLNALCQIIGNRTSYHNIYVQRIGQQCPFFFIAIQLICGLSASCIYFIQPLVILVAIAGVYLMNGAIYSSGVQYIDTRIHRRYNLVALSVWFLFADIGSIIGQNAFEPIVQYVCHKHPDTSYCG